MESYLKAQEEYKKDVLAAQKGYYGEMSFDLNRKNFITYAMNNSLAHLEGRHQHYWLIVNDEYAGTVSISFQSPKSSPDEKGNVGCMIAPSFRGENLSEVALKLALNILKEKGCKTALTVVKEENIPSVACNRKVMQEYGGNGYEEKRKNNQGDGVIYFWHSCMPKNASLQACLREKESSVKILSL